MASADWCYSAQCVPNVAFNVAEGTSCVPQPRRAFAFRLEPDGGTVVCNPAGVWTAAGPLIGVYNVAMRCPSLNLSAQGSDGIALQCMDDGGGDCTGRTGWTFLDRRQKPAATALAAAAGSVYLRSSRP